jgi:hypothetical protein
MRPDQWVVERDDDLLAGRVDGNPADPSDGTRTPDIPADNGSYPVPEGTTMTDDELRIIAFLNASAATRPDDLPDWMLALLEGDRPEEMSHELITAASLIYFRRLHPGIGLDAARSLMAEYAADPARLADLSARIAAFRLACAFERLKRAGRIEDVFIDDPFDPEAEVSVELTEARWQSTNRESPSQDAPPERN